MCTCGPICLYNRPSFVIGLELLWLLFELHQKHIEEVFADGLSQHSLRDVFFSARPAHTCRKGRTFPLLNFMDMFFFGTLTLSDYIDGYHYHLIGFGCEQKWNNDEHAEKKRCYANKCAIKTSNRICWRINVCFLRNFISFILLRLFLLLFCFKMFTLKSILSSSTQLVCYNRFACHLVQIRSNIYLKWRQTTSKQLNMLMPIDSD